MQFEMFQAEKPLQTELPFIGCAGWSLSSANKHLFPSRSSHLESYAAVFPCVEINSSFYRLHRADTYARWRESVPESFRFSVKLLRTVTHIKRLQGCEQDLQDFMQSVRLLEYKWGCLLVQLPPSLPYHQDHAQSFFQRLRELTEVLIACEPRHPSWFQPQVLEWMSSLGVIYVDADPPIVQSNKVIGSQETNEYIRLHGSPIMYHSPYSESFLEQLACRVRTAHATGRQCWCIFDNTASGAAVENAHSLLLKVRRPAAAQA